MKYIYALLVLLSATTSLAAQTTDTTAASRPDSIRVTFGGFIDSYYAYDFNRPPSFDRSYTTQPARHNEFNVNLAFIEAKVAADRIRGRIALQAGTSVQLNYAGEPTLGFVSGPLLSRAIQEAVAGVRVADGLWIDGGIYFSHIGFETFISRDNWTYTRSLMSDYSPYYQTGIRASYQISDAVSTQLHLMNGWQNISETNNRKAVGMQLAYNPTPGFSLTYNNFIGYELPDSLSVRRRIFNDLIVRLSISKSLQVAAIADLGVQRRGPGDIPVWYVLTALGRLQISSTVAASARVEYYADRSQVIVATGTPSGFQTLGGSLGVDVAPDPHILWRVELRGFSSKDAIYPLRDVWSNDDGFVVTSLALSF